VYNTDSIQATSQQVNGLNPNTLYFWRVRSASGSTQGFYSVKFSFTTGTASGLQETGPLTAVSLSPNPATSVLTVRGHMKTSGDLIMRICDISGRMVFDEIFPSVTGDFSRDLNIRMLDAGAYFLELILENHSITRRIIKTKE
jgi:hypothetical protein